MRQQFQIWVAQYRHRVYGLAYYLLRQRETAEDVTQEVFIKLWTHRAAIDPTRLEPWLLRVTRNACIDAQRKQGAYTKHVQTDSDAYALDQASTDTDNPLVHTERAEFQATLEKALRDLQEPYRSILILREIQGLKYEEVAETLDLPLNTLKVYLHRARKMLRQKLEPYYRPDHANA